MVEIREILAGEGITFCSLHDENLQDIEIIEDGKTFEEKCNHKS